uniref:Uncharacterized protein n=1 Tax=Araucaria cunninghamii TaxID=56994 RepID=A0A0D6QZX7_ARACU
MGRQPCCDKVGLKKGPWTAEEDRKLVDFIANHGHCCWRTVPKLAGLLRCGKSCRLRWTNYLRPDLKRGVLSDMEEKLIIELHSHLGNRWAKIAAQLPGRTDNEIKNYWNTHIKKKLRRMGIDPVTHLPIAEAQLSAQGIQNVETEAAAPKPVEELPKGETTENSHFPSVKLEALSTSASTNLSDAFEDDKSVDTSSYAIPSRFGVDAVCDGNRSNPGGDQAVGKMEGCQKWEPNDITMLLGQQQEEEVGVKPLIMPVADDNLWELSDFVDSNLALEHNSMASSSCNAGLEPLDLQWGDGHQAAAHPHHHHMDMLVAGSIFSPFEMNAQLWGESIDLFPSWEGAGTSSTQASEPVYVD